MCDLHNNYLDMVSEVDVNDKEWVYHLELIDYDKSPVDGQTISYNAESDLDKLKDVCMGEDKSMGIDIVGINKKTGEVIREEVYSNI